jgi:hypothetical protein
MAKLLFARIAGGLAITLLALVFVSILPLLSAARSASYFSTPSGVTINQELKGDQLPVHTAVNAAMLSAAFNAAILKSDFDSLASLSAPRAQSQTETSREIPVGCDPSFSPVAAPRLAYVYGRCTS